MTLENAKRTLAKERASLSCRYSSLNLSDLGFRGASGLFLSFKGGHVFVLVFLFVVILIILAFHGSGSAKLAEVDTTKVLYLLLTRSLTY
jgi:hypothetical protein